MNTHAQPKLYFSPGSSSFSAVVAFEEAAADYEIINVALGAGEQRTPRYLAVNPRGRIPALDVEGRILTENLSVLTYVAARFPDARLLPFGDPLALARAYELLSWFVTGLHVEIAKIWRTERFTTDDTAALLVQASGRTKFEDGLTEIESIAGRSGAWLLGEQFTLVDAFGLVLWRWSLRLQLDIDRFPAWKNQVTRAFARPAVQRAVSREAAAAKSA